MKKPFIRTRILAKISTLFSLLFATLIGYMWYQIEYDPFKTRNEVSSQKQLDKRISKYNKLYTRNNELPTYIPTGIFIQSLEFTNAHTVNMSGYIWQKYSSHLLQKKITPGVNFIESTHFYGLSEAIDINYADYKLIMWDFNRLQVTQQFSYSKYPFDIQHVWIRLWPAEFFHNIILIPDLASYNINNHPEIIGLEKNMVTWGMNITRSYFSMEQVPNYDTNFGIKNFVYRNSFPEFNFNIILNRNFNDSFIHDLLPIIVAWSILFALIMMISTNSENLKQVGLSANGVLFALGSTFFSILIANANLRQNFPGQPIVYMEYFYILTYIVIILIALNALLITAKKNVPRILSWRSNLFPKLIFWPVILGTMMIATYLRFYVF